MPCIRDPGLRYSAFNGSVLIHLPMNRIRWGIMDFSPLSGEWNFHGYKQESLDWEFSYDYFVFSDPLSAVIFKLRYG